MKLRLVIWEFPKIREPYFGVLIIRILLFEVLYQGPLFSETPISTLAYTTSAKQAREQKLKAYIELHLSLTGSIEFDCILHIRQQAPHSPARFRGEGSRDWGLSV